MSAQSQAQNDSVEANIEDKMLRTEDLPTPDSSAGAKEASVK